MQSLFRLSGPLSKALVLAVGLGALSLSGCGKEEPTPQPVAQPDPVETTPAPTDAFVLSSSGGEDYDGRPALRLTFSQPLVAEQTFDELLVVRDANGADVKGSWVLDEDEPNVLRFPYVQSDKTYTISIKQGLATPDGRTLNPLTDQKIYSGNLLPSVGFASRGSVLPARGTQGLPIISVNTSDVDVEFFRIRDKDLASFLQKYSDNRATRYTWDLSGITKLADSVYANRFALNAKANERQVSFLPVHSISELRETGVYFAVMHRAGSFDSQYQTTYFYVTDLGLHARQQSNGLFVHAASLDSGEPRKGVELQLLDGKGQPLATAHTNSEGQATLEIQPKSDSTLIARAGSEIALVAFNQPALDLSEYQVAGRSQTAQDVYAWSGRDLFRPGEVLQVSALLRDHDGRPLPQAQTLYATLRQPDGRAISVLPLEPQAQGYYSYQRTLAEDAPTGRWSLEYRLDPSAPEPVGRFAFRIEEFLPERLKLTLDSSQARLAAGDRLKLDVDAAFLYGAPAAGNRFLAELLYRPALQPIPALKGYFFGDPTITLPKEPQEAIDTTLADNGKLNQELTLLDGATPPAAPFEVIVSGSVFESGGRAIRRSMARTVWPAEALVGVRPMFDPDSGPNSNSEVGFEIVKANAEGQLLAADKLKVKLVREMRDYHWSWVDDSGWSTDYTTRHIVLEETELSYDGKTPARFQAQVEWGEHRLEITDPATGLTSRYSFVAGWSWDNDNQGLDARPDKVKVSFDQSSYRAGDTATVTITAPYDGHGVLLVESDRILHRTQFKARGNTQIKFKVGQDFIRHDVYVSALVFRPADQGKLIGPGRALGVAHLPISSGPRDTTLDLKVPELTRPGQSMEVEISASEFAGQEAWAVVEATDLGIINLTGYPLPDANNYFLAQRRLGIDAYDLYGRVIGPLEGERARLRFGGDAALASLPQARRPTAKVQTVALHAEPVRFDAQGKATVRFTAPDFNGSLRVAALAYSNERYAKAGAETIVRAPLVMEVSTPRVMAPGDRGLLTVDLHNLSGKEASYTISTETRGPIAIEGGSRSVQLADNARTTLSFPLTAHPGNQVGAFKLKAQTPDGELERSYEISVRSAWPAVRRNQARQITDAQTVNFGPNLFQGLQAESGKAQISVSSVPPLPFAASIDGLIEYPYGCVEQTSSRLWPLVNLDPASARKFGLEPLDEGKRKRMIDHGFSRIAAMQNEAGRFTFWPGDGWVDPQMTAYIADLLVTAKNNGLEIPESVLEKALNRLNEDLLSGGNSFYDYDNAAHLRFASSAYAGYVLARVNRAPLGTLRTLWDNQRERSLTALPLMRLGIALKLAGDETRSAAAIKAALEKQSKRPRYLGDYGSALRDEALLLALLYEHGLMTPEAASRISALTRDTYQSAREGYLSTQERLAIFRLGRAMLSDSHTGMQGQFLIAGKPEALSGRSSVTREVDIDDLRRGVSLALESGGPFWIEESIVGYPSHAPNPTSQDNGIRIERRWFHTDGKPFQGNRLTEGDSLIAMIQIESKEKVQDALIVDLLPGGVEIENLSLGGNDAFGELTLGSVQLSERSYSADLRYEEYRDDRYVAAVKLWPDTPAHLFYLVRAVSPGTYVVPPPSVEDMYRPQINATGHSTPDIITVVSPQ